METIARFFVVLFVGLVGRLEANLPAARQITDPVSTPESNSTPPRPR